MLQRLKNYFRVMPINNLLVLKKTVLVLAIGWTLLIAFLCLITFHKLPTFGVSGTDKLVHLTFHFFFVLFWGWYSIIKNKEILLSKIVRIVTISLVYGVIIEFLQEAFTTSRHADFLDVIANLIGALLALVALMSFKKIKTHPPTR